MLLREILVVYSENPTEHIHTLRIYWRTVSMLQKINANHCMPVYLLTDFSSHRTNCRVQQEQHCHCELPDKILLWARTVQPRQAPFAHWEGTPGSSSAQNVCVSRSTVDCDLGANQYLNCNERESTILRTLNVQDQRAMWFTYTLPACFYFSPDQLAWTSNSLTG